MSTRITTAEEMLNRINESFRARARGWQPIETAPKDGTRVLLYGVEADRLDAEPEVWRGEWSTSAWYGPAWVGCENRSDTEYIRATHWMPLPAPPQEPSRS